VIAPCGELDLSNAAQLEERLAGSIDTVLDLSKLSFIDSTGLHVLVSAANRAQSEGWEFTVQNPQPAVLRVIKLVGLAQRLSLESQNGPTSHPEEDAKQPPRPRGEARGPVNTTLGLAAQ
jgi:anti-sigma B factor antagonist